MVAVKRCVDNGTKPYTFADADNTPLYTCVVNTSDKYSKHYYNTTAVELAQHRYDAVKNSGSRFFVDDVKTENPFDIQTPIP